MPGVEGAIYVPYLCLHRAHFTFVRLLSKINLSHLFRCLFDAKLSRFKRRVEWRQRVMLHLVYPGHNARGVLPESLLPRRCRVFGVHVYWIGGSREV